MTTPYFYVIEHIDSGKKYAGCRFGKNCHPKELLEANGYFTSSGVIKKLIEEEGVESFRILDIILEEEIKIPFGWNNILDFETCFLQENNCSADTNWINKHNNWITKKGTPIKHTVWNKGLTKEIDERIMKAAVKSTITKTEAALEPWNKGLTKETDERVRQGGINEHLTKKKNVIIPWNKGLTGIYSEESINKMKKSAKRRFMKNNVVNDFEKENLQNK